MKACRFTLCVLVLLIANAANANECLAIDDDAERLVCFDALFDEEQPNQLAEAPPESDWVVRVQTSEMTDETNVYMTVRSTDVVSCSWARGQPVTLMLRCQEDTTSIIFQTGCHMTSSRYNDYGDVVYRLDSERPRTRGFVESTNNRSLGLWSGGTAIPFIRAMLGKDRLLARMTPYGDNPIEMEFNISGLDQAIVPLREACGW
ncbi:type VI secretion system-associated protein TagO [Pararhodobacter oceanensis]|uniref:Type VI secretion system-associated protein TagO n=1 Tax=Pararhodobacter oceanensis TaxID=2172121 RepID=A0A2T8HY48_9RHOB|nr:type VI secretion system-associated protein TagO [Pararhodobacter oceanensis]PVH30363.1 hypothetical protein DDE20_02085 [Pararhodobacter oceanensis]